MFGSKQTSAGSAPSPEIQDDSLRIHTIPKAFYGKTITATDAAPTREQLNPSGAATHASAMMNAAQSTTSIGSVFDTPGPSAQAQIQHAPAHSSKMRVVLWSSLGVVVLAVAGTATWFYTRETTPTPVIDVPVNTIAQEPEQTIPQDAVIATTSTVITDTPPTLDPDILLPIPSVGDTIDFDGDGLTDVEEELYKTDPAIADTDLDTFTDGVELTNLFDPLIEAPAMLEESQNIARYVNPVHDYSVFHPRDWLAAPVDEQTSDEVTFTSLTGEFVTIQAFPLKENELFVSWFATHNPSMQYSALTSWSNRREQTGWYEPSFMRFYFVNQKSVFVMEYHPGIRNAVNFRRSVRMMAESFVMGELKDATEPPGAVFGQPTTTTTPSVTTSTSSATSLEPVATSTTP